MNIFQQDPQTIASALLQRMHKRNCEHMVYCQENGVVRVEAKSQPRLKIVNDRDIVGCYTKHSDVNDLADDLSERLKEVAQIREIMR